MTPLSRWFTKRQTDRDLAAEMAEHLEEKIEQLRSEGLSDEEARMRARRQLHPSVVP